LNRHFSKEDTQMVFEKMVSITNHQRHTNQSQNLLGWLLLKQTNNSNNNKNRK
jgi:hypothetical protein